MATRGKAMDPNAGSWTIDPVFEGTSFNMDYLTNPTPLLDLGIDFNKVKVAERVQPSDQLLIIAYPHFNVNGRVWRFQPVLPLHGWGWYSSLAKSILLAAQYPA